MTHKEAFLGSLAAFVNATVIAKADPLRPDSLQFKIDVLQRVLEILRLKTGIIETTITVEDLLRSGLDVIAEPYNTPHIVVGRADSSSASAGLLSRSELRECDLQVPLLLFMARDYRKLLSIRHLIPSFVSAITPALCARDMERTATGVTRIATNVRLAARTLRDYGILNSSSEIAYKRWEFTTSGLLAAAILHRENHRVEQLAKIVSSFIERDTNGLLAPPIRRAFARLSSAELVTESVHSLCGSNQAVLPTFALALKKVAAFWTDYEEGRFDQSAAELRDQAKVLLDQLSDSIPIESLRQDFSKDFALRELQID